MIDEGIRYPLEVEGGSFTVWKTLEISWSRFKVWNVSRCGSAMNDAAQSRGGKWRNSPLA
jgi:hypothetical protein